MATRHGHVLGIRVVVVSYREDHHLGGHEPGGKRPGIVLEQDGKEPFDRPEERAMDHHGAVARVVRPDVLEPEAHR